MARTFRFSFVLVVILTTNVNSAFAQTWESIEWEYKAEEPPVQSSILRFNDVFFLDPNNAVGLDTFGLADNKNCRIVRTSDGWKTWNTQFTLNDIPFDVFFLDAQKGWVVGSSGDILHTEDGGLSWRKLSNYPGGFISIYFIDANQGWAGGYDEAIIHTTDGGITWEKQYGFKGPLCGAIRFINALEGWACDSDCNILHTTDGGKTWNKKASGVKGSFRDMVFASKDVGWIVGWPGVILHTEDGGNTWLQQKSGTDAVLRRIHIVDENEVWVCGNEYHENETDPQKRNVKVLLHTKDRGKTWQNISDRIPAPDLDWVQFFNQDEGYAVSWWGGIYHTKDSGITWQTEREPVVPLISITRDHWDFRKVFFVNENTGWLLAEGGLIFHVSDEGKTQKLQKDATNSAVFTGISFIDEKEGWVVGLDYSSENSDVIFHTKNGGVEWEQIKTQKFWPQDVHFFNSKEGCMAAQNIFYTNDSGKTWKMVSPKELVAGPLEQVGYIGCIDLDFIDSEHGWGVYVFGKVVHTEDGGKTWDVIDRTIKPLDKVDFVNDKEGWGIGRETVWKGNGEDFARVDSFIFHTENGGKSWIAVLEIKDCLMSNLCFVNNKEGWVIGTLASATKNPIISILHTTDGGNTWNEQFRKEYTTDMMLTDICYDGADSLYAVGYNNCILRYTDPSLRKGQAVDPSDKVVTTWGKIKNQLFQNYPNPFNPDTWIPYQLAEDSEATISIYDSEGQLVRTLELGRMKLGKNQAYWDGKDEKGQTVASGIYFYVLKAGEFSGIKKMTLVR